MRLHTLALLAAGFPASLSAQEPRIPQPVIAQCNAAQDAAGLPECLKIGAVAFGMLERVRGADYYGAAAEPVIAACAERNADFSGQWGCFQSAAGKAAETRSLIGIEAIADACVAGISDPELAERIKNEHQAQLEDVLGEYWYSALKNYYVFSGCPAPPSDSEAAAAQAGAPEPSAPQAAAPEPGSQDPADPADVYTAEACAAFADVEAVLTANSSDDLRAMAARLEEADEVDEANFTRITGAEESTRRFLESATDEQMRAGFWLIFALFREIHPELAQEVLHGQTLPPDPAEAAAHALGRAIGTQFVEAVYSGALSTYRSHCPAE